MELQIYNPTAENSVKKIEWNFEELKKELTEKAKMYGSLVYTDENIKEAKADRAKLNKFIKALEDGRKDVKKMMLAPYTDFENQVKELVAIVSEANSNIDSQVKAYDQKKREEKLIKVEEIYETVFSGEEAKSLQEIITFDRAFKETYLNASTTLKSITNEMEHLRDTVRHDIEVINADNGEYQFEMKQAYLRNLDMTEAISVKQQYEENARKKAEYEAKRQAELKEREAREKAEAEKLAEVGRENNSEQKTESVNEKKEEVSNDPKSMVTINLCVKGTIEQLTQLKEFLTQNDIEFGPVK